MFEIYAAAEVPDVAFKSSEFLARDLETRFAQPMVQEIRSNFPIAVQYVAAENTMSGLINTMDVAFEHEALKGDFHLVKIKVSVEVELVKR